VRRLCRNLVLISTLRVCRERGGYRGRRPPLRSWIREHHLLHVPRESCSRRWCEVAGGSASFYCSDIYGNQDGPGDVGDQFVASSPYHNILSDPEYCDPEHGDYHLRKSSPCYVLACGARGARPPVIFCYTQNPTHLPGTASETVSLGADPQVSDLRALAGDHGLTSISFRLTGATQVSLQIMDSNGRLVRTLTAGHLGSGEHRIAWDRRAGSGAPAAGGVHPYALQAGAETVLGRRVLLR
jgi:hypothetical protein